MRLLLLPLSALLLVDALLNVTIDDVSPMISYSGKWEPSATHMSGLDYGGSHTLSSDSEASATFIFTGVAVYYLSPRWPYAVSTRLSLDGGAPILVNLTDSNSSPTLPGGPESALSSVAWSATSLANKSHTLVATIGNFIIVDGFIYTVDNGSTPISSSSSATSSSTTSSLSSSATLSASSAGASTIPSNHSGLTIGLATALALSVVVAAALFAFAYYQRRRHRKVRSVRPRPILDDWSSEQRGRGAYAAVTGHALDVSDASSSNLLNMSVYPASGLSDPWEPGDVQYQGFTASSQGQASEGSSVSSHGRVRYAAELPPGAMPAAVPGPYMDRAPPDDDEGPALNRAPSSRPLLSSHHLEDGETTPVLDGIRISSPPPYSARS
ncbi:hypothetical protein B0H17DRAFT_971690 [Mycena rosella]|uniref:Uncharacterized protein n=1 Tax=Mycena rosella TaxID=1033263 RepID=A0AAD7GYH3_MYCRO|nr:hypothetical protein B0H17DRAFT_971690 [Mycena rosella]